MNYPTPDPDQPRQPKGSPNAGEWAPKKNPEPQLILPPIEMERRRLAHDQEVIEALEKSLSVGSQPAMIESTIPAFDEVDDTPPEPEFDPLAPVPVVRVVEEHPSSPYLAPGTPSYESPTYDRDRREYLYRPEYDWGGQRYFGPVPIVLGREETDIEGSWRYPPWALRDVEKMCKFWASTPIPDEALANIQAADRWGRDVKRWEGDLNRWMTENHYPGRLFRKVAPGSEEERWLAEHGARKKDIEKVRNCVGFLYSGDLRSVARIGAYYLQMKRAFDISTWTKTPSPDVVDGLNRFWNEASRAVFLLDTGEPVEAEAYVKRFHLEEIELAYFNRYIYPRYGY